jgi:hypothetical protein
VVKPKAILVASGILVLVGVGITVFQSQTIDEFEGKQQNHSESMTIIDILVSAMLAIGLGGLFVGMLYLIKSRGKMS